MSIEIIGGRAFYVRDNTDEFYALKEIFVKGDYQLPDGFEMESGTVVDIGANVGGFSVLASRWPGVKRVIAFEPNGDVYSRFLLNTAGIPQIIGANLALSNYEGSGIMWIPGGRTGSAGLHRSPKNAEPVRVRIRKAYDALAFLGEIDVLKIDTEGSEPEILESIAPLLPCIRLIFLEWHSLKDLAICEDALSGYDLTITPRRESIGIMRAIRRSES